MAQWKLFLTMFFHVWLQTAGMFQKRASYIQKQGPLAPEQRLRANLGDLFLSNTVTGARSQSLFEDCHNAGVYNTKKLARAGNKGKCQNHCKRDLTRAFLKNTGWPPLYWADIRIYNPRTQKVELRAVPFLLPHEILNTLAKECSDIQCLYNTAGMAMATKKHVELVSAQVGCPLVGCSLWADGVPFNFDRSQSLDVITFLLPGLEDGLRIPLCAIHHKHVMKLDTLDDIFAILAWSYRHMLEGVHPVTRHDGTAFKPNDKKRKKWAGQQMLCRGILAETRADWKFFQEAFRFPQWNVLTGCCWMCPVTPDKIREVGSTAAWRTTRFDHWALMTRMVSLGCSISPLFSCPYFKSTNCLVDWLHTMDQGVSADWMGNILWHLLEHHMQGGTRLERCSSLFREITAYYRHFQIASRLDNLTVKMLRKGSASPKLKSRAAECRFLIHFGLLACRKYLSEEDPFESQISHGMKHLYDCYQMLHRDSFDAESMAQSSRRFCLIAVAVEEMSPTGLWGIKPKLHLMQELLEECPSNPSTHWVYRDEEFGGTIAGIGRRHGGHATPGVAGQTVLHQFVAAHRIPNLG